jgi:hypothetical protein
MSSSHTGYIYLIREEDHVVLNLPFFRVGMTQQEPDKGLSKYKQGSEIMLVIQILDAKETASIKAEITKAFRKKFTFHSDGHEYFIGDGYEMQDIIAEVVTAENKKYRSLLK